MPSEEVEESKTSGSRAEVPDLEEDIGGARGSDDVTVSDTASIAESIDPAESDEKDEKENESVQGSLAAYYANKENIGVISSREPMSMSRVRLGEPYDVLDSTGRWCEGEVTKIDMRNNRVYVSYLYWDSRFDEWVDDIPSRIVPIHTNTYHYGGKLKLGQRIEALDETQQWLEAFVVAEEEDRVQVHYKGYHPKYDAWIKRSDTSRFLPYGRRKYGGMKFSPQVLWGTRVEGSASSASSAPAPSAGRVRYIDDEARTRKIQNLSSQYQQYKHALEAQDLTLVPVAGDGNCLFRSVAHQIYGDDAQHHLVRQKCMDYMESEADFFSQFIVGGREMFPVYVAAKRRDACWGDDPEIQAICELYNRPAEIWAYDTTRGARKLRTFHENMPSSSTASSSSSGAEGPVMRLSYYGGGHYDSIVGAQHRAHLIIRKPGEVEDIRIALSKNRSLLGANARSGDRGGVGGVEEVRRLSDLEATEALAVDAALQDSRRMQHSREFEDLETCLLQSLIDQGKGPGRGEVEDSKDNAGDELMIIQGIKEETERDYIESAILDSLRGEGEPNKREELGAGTGVVGVEGVEQLLQLALVQSEQEAIARQVEDQDLLLALDLSRMSEEEALEMALQASMQPISSPPPTASSSRNPHPAPTHSSSSSSQVYLEDEDEELRRAIEASLGGGNGHVHVARVDQIPPQFVPEEEMDEDLMRAIQESLRK